MAFDATIAALESREVSILQLFFMEGMSTKAIGQSYGVSDRTVQRWLAAVREKMMEDFHRRLALRLKVSDTEMGSILNLVRSQVAIRLPERFHKEKEQENDTAIISMSYLAAVPVMAE